MVAPYEPGGVELLQVRGGNFVDLGEASVLNRYP